MNDFWSLLTDKISSFLVNALNNHPGKVWGTFFGFLLGLLLVILGFWKFLILTTFVALGFFVGKRQDDNEDVISWLDNIFHRN